MIDVVIALKAMDRVKTRLADHLNLARRQSLALAMAKDVLAVMSAWPSCQRVYLLVGDGRHEGLLESPKALWVHESSLLANGLNGLLSAAVGLTQSDEILLLHGDLPWLNAADLVALEALRGTNELIICPDQQWVGTNAILMPVDCDLSLCFGRSSFQRHVDGAQAQGLRLATCHTKGFAWDVDLLSDVHSVRHAACTHAAIGANTRTWAGANPVPKTDRSAEPRGRVECPPLACGGAL